MPFKEDFSLSDLVDVWIFTGDESDGPPLFNMCALINVYCLEFDVNHHKLSNILRTYRTKVERLKQSTTVIQLIVKFIIKFMV